MAVVDLVKDLLVSKGITENIFKHHANDPGADHILLTQSSQNRRTDDGLKNYFNDNIRVLVNKVNSNFETVLLLKDNIINELVKLHATAEIIDSSLIAESEPVKINSKTIQWAGVFRVIGQIN